MDKKYKAEFIDLMERAYRQGYQDGMMDTGNQELQNMSSVDFADYVTRKGKRIAELLTQTTFTGDGSWIKK